VRKEADSYILQPNSKLAKIYGSDTDPAVIHLVQSVLQNAMAPWKNLVYVKAMDFRGFKPKMKPTLVVTNPPHGNRIGEVEELKELYSNLPQTLQNKVKAGTRVVLFTVPQLAKEVPGISSGPVDIPRSENTEAQLFEFSYPTEQQLSQAEALRLLKSIIGGAL